MLMGLLEALEVASLSLFVPIGQAWMAAHGAPGISRKRGQALNRRAD